MTAEPTETMLTPDEQRIVRAMRDVRRGTTTFRLRTKLYSDDTDRLDQGQSDALDLLVSRGTCRMVEAADIMRTAPPPATRPIGRLVDAGLVERDPPPPARRPVLVRATAAGLERHEQIDQSRQRFLRTVFD